MLSSQGEAGAVRAAQTPEADITITKSADEAVAVGGTITYNIVVSNGGPDAATDVVVTDPIPAYTTYVSATSETGTVTFEDNTLTVTFSTIPAFEGRSISLVVSINSDTPRGTTISNTATVTSETPDPETSNNSSTATTVVIGPFAGDLLISEVRFRGPGGVNDEYVELYNNTDSPIFVSTTDASSGWAVAASDGAVRFVIPNGTNIPARGHYLGVNSDGYSLSSYPAGQNVGAVGDATYTNDIPDNAGVALFSTSNPSNFSATRRLDAVGFSAVSSTTYREGSGLATPVTGNVEHAFVRKLNSGTPQDSNDNAADFVLVATGGSTALAGSQLGAPGPENTQSPIQRNAQFPASLIEPAASESQSPNRVRSGVTLSIRRRFTNQTGETITRLRFRVVDITTLGTPVAVAPQADLRLLTSGDTTIVTSRGTLLVQGTMLEQPPAQRAGGGLNTSASVALPGEGLLPGASLDVQFVLNVVQGGRFRFFINVEGLTATVNEESLIQRELPVVRRPVAAPEMP